MDRTNVVDVPCRSIENHEVLPWKSLYSGSLLATNYDPCHGSVPAEVLRDPGRQGQSVFRYLAVFVHYNKSLFFCPCWYGIVLGRTMKSTGLTLYQRPCPTEDFQYKISSWQAFIHSLWRGWQDSHTSIRWATYNKRKLFGWTGARQRRPTEEGNSEASFLLEREEFQ